MMFRIKVLWGILFFCLGCYTIASQDQDRADSLKLDYREGTYEMSEKKILTLITESETNPDSILAYADILINKAGSYASEGFTSEAYIYGYLAKGHAFQSQGHNSKAIQEFLKSLNFAEQSKDKRSISFLQISLADTYVIMENYENADKYYEKGIRLLRIENDSLNLAIALLNVGDMLITLQKYDQALVHFNESSRIYKDLNHKLGLAYNYGNIGIVHAEQGKDDLAEKNINKAIEVLEEAKDFYPMSVYLTYLADIYADKDNYEFAFKYADRSLKLAEIYGLKEQISDANLKLSQLHEASGSFDKAFQYFQTHIIYRDSVRNIKEVQKIGNAIASKNEAELNVEKEKRKNQRIVIWSTVGVLLLTGFLAFSLFKRHKFVKATNKIIASEKERSDNLLLNILPEDTAEELKEKGRVAAKKYEAVTVFFSDFKGFTKYAENLSPEILVETIDHYFSKFDEIIDKYGLEKIKTIGDAYMAAGGLNYDNEDHAKHMILAAQEMIDFVHKTKHDDNTDGSFDIRIGINTGPVVAGVVGTKKFAFDIWGDTVNIAARMESSSEPGRINISEDTYKIVQSDFGCEYRGELAVKNRGHLKMYFIDS